MPEEAQLANLLIKQIEKVFAILYLINLTDGVCHYLLTSVQGPLLKEWISQHGSIMAVTTLPSSLFNADAKAIYVLKKGPAAHATFAHPLSSLTDRESLEIFMEEFTKTVKL